MSDPSNRDERLRAALRRGDPGAGDPSLAPEDVQAMRRAVLSALPEPRRGFRLAPVFGTLAAAALVLVLGFAVWRALGPDPDAPSAPAVADRPAAPTPAPRPAPVPEPPQAAAGLETSIQAAAAEPRPEERMAARGSARRRSGPPRAAGEPVLARHAADPMLPIPSAPDRPVEEIDPEEPLTRQVQLTAPGGTRIIWLLTGESPSR